MPGRTAIISDLHLGKRSGDDLLRDPRFRDILMEEIGKADRVVLLGDTVEMFERPLKTALELARPFLEDLGAAMSGRSVLLVPGNHDHYFAKPILEGLAAESRQLGLEHRSPPASRESECVAEWLGDAELELAYPGVWLRDDVYATHGHYVDCYRRLPRLECISTAVVMRTSGALPDNPTPKDYERVVTPVYGMAFRLAQVGLAHRVTHPSDRIWRAISNRGSVEEKEPSRTVERGVRLLNRLLRSDIKVDLTPDALSETGIAAATELMELLEIEAAHVITGHTHRAGPTEEDEPWVLPGGGRLHNTGCWVLTSAFRDLGSHGRVYRPGAVTWLEESGPPRRSYPLADHFGEDVDSASGPLALEAL